MIDREPFERRPFLAGVTDELPFVFANWTTRRRFRSRSKLRPALHADKIFYRFRTLIAALSSGNAVSFLLLRVGRFLPLISEGEE